MANNPASKGSDEYWWWEIATSYYGNAHAVDSTVEAPVWNDSKSELMRKVVTYTAILVP